MADIGIIICEIRRESILLQPVRIIAADADLLYSEITARVTATEVVVTHSLWWDGGAPPGGDFGQPPPPFSARIKAIGSDILYGKHIW